eukprot:1291735-Rhodomonas_salina.2
MAPVGTEKHRVRWENQLLSSLKAVFPAPRQGGRSEEAESEEEEEEEEEEEKEEGGGEEEAGDIEDMGKSSCGTGGASGGAMVTPL